MDCCDARSMSLLGQSLRIYSASARIFVHCYPNSDLSRQQLACPKSADIVAKVFLHWRSKILRAAGAAFV
jgi:hypothetical protein